MIHALDLAAVAVFAISGALAAGRKKLDLFGLVVVGMVTAVGGGTLRDLLLDVPVYWVARPEYVVTGTIAALAAFVAGPGRFPHSVLLIADALGLALATVIGAQKAHALGVAPVIVVVMSTMTGAAGGVLRDLLCGEVPLILRREIYATAALAGGVVYEILVRNADERVAVAAAAATVLLIRMAAIRWGLSLPTASER